MKKISLIFLVLLSFNLYGNDSLFISANNDYANKNYLSASEKYENILSYNLESVELYYNLGNSYFKLDEIHKAIYNYEKALIIDQDFTEAKENIELSKLKLIDKIDEMPELFFISIYKGFFRPIFCLDTLNLEVIGFSLFSYSLYLWI